MFTVSAEALLPPNFPLLVCTCHLVDTSAASHNVYLSLSVVQRALVQLQDAGCLNLGLGEDGDEGGVTPTTTGRIASFYYLQ